MFGDPPWIVNSSNHILDSQTWDPTRGQGIPWPGMKTYVTDGGTVRNLDSTHEEFAQAYSLWKQVGGSRLKLLKMLADFLPPPQCPPQSESSAHFSLPCSAVQLHTRTKAPMAEEQAQCRCGTSWDPAWHLIVARIAITGIHGRRVVHI